MMKQLSLQEIKQILDSGDFDEFTDVRENFYLEAKPTIPYLFKTSGQSAFAEFAKDVASIANSKGGFILCGLKTDKKSDSTSPHEFDVITNPIISLINKDTFYNQEDINKFAYQYIFPKIKLDVKWYKYSKDHNLGLGSIYIPPQEEDKKHFITRISDNSSRNIKHYFAIPIRNDDEPKWIKVEEIYRKSKKIPSSIQKQYINLSEQISEVKNLINLLPNQTTTVNIDSIPAMIEDTING